MTRCITYSRVSSERQVKEGHGLDSQEKRCIDYAVDKGYKILANFREEGLTGGLFERPAMKLLLQFLDDNDSNNPNDKIIVIFDDLKRFARDTVIHFKLKTEIYARNGTVESPNFKFEDTPDGKFVETVMAAHAELEKNQNRRQVIQKQKARLELGYWAFDPPLGLQNEKDPIHGKILKSVEPYASILKEAIEKFRDGLLLSPQDVRQFIADTYKAKGINKKISLNGANLILRKVLYAGYIEYPPWGVTLRKGKHTGFISLETYNLVQTRLKERSKVPWAHRKDYNPIFPLRCGYVLCDACGKPLTATCSHNGRDGKLHPSYFCKNKACPKVWDVIHKTIIETQFLELLGNVRLPEELIELAKHIFTNVWEEKRNRHLSSIHATLEEKADLEKKMTSYLERIGITDDESLIKIYEAEIGKLSRKIKVIESETNTDKYTNTQFGTALEKVFEVLKKPVDMWQSNEIEDKRTVLFMYFEDKLRYNHQTGFGTRQLGRTVSLIKQIGESKNPDVEMPGNEPGSEGIHQKLLQA